MGTSWHVLPNLVCAEPSLLGFGNSIILKYMLVIVTFVSAPVFCNIIEALLSGHLPFDTISGHIIMHLLIRSL
jgi:hypothetical protein